MAIAIFKTIFERRKKIKKRKLVEKCRGVIKYFASKSIPKSTAFEKLTGDLDRAFSRRINIQHRIVYQIIKEEKVVRILRMWTHYE